ncbi:MAG: toxin-antitoxin system YwqK family antitoxin [Fusobacteriaceae bacterium]|jgi:antitoxin component YwqK of YwqJK toxin-antitoxin module|nr:toxin-antitoxin system YwqK family antitoxin [Fusobacteriaceae bacterium]
MKKPKTTILILLALAVSGVMSYGKGKFREIQPLLPNNTGVGGNTKPVGRAGPELVEEDIVIQQGTPQIPEENSGDSDGSRKSWQPVDGSDKKPAENTPYELIPIKIGIDPADSKNDILDQSEKKPETQGTTAGTQPAVTPETAETGQQAVTPTGPAGKVPDRKIIPPPSDRNLDFSNKDTINEIVYAKGEDEPFTGVFTAYIGNVIEYSETYVKGVLDGEEIWYSNGKPNMVYVYKGGKLNGDSYMYYEDGLVKNVQSYKNGNIVSLVSYDRNGRVLHKSAFPDGTGNWKIFWDNGNVLEEGNYKGWKKDGQWKRYQSDGTVDNIKKYQNGKLTGESWN